MALAPRSGSREKSAVFVYDKVLKKPENIKVIQPQVLCSLGNSFFWSLKIIRIGQLKAGITKRHEIGFVIVEEKGEKFKFLYKKLEGEIESS